LQEGFGLPFLEATAARRPLIARRLPNVAPDLRRFGFRFPQYYDDVLVDPRLFDWRAERDRQGQLFRAWRDALPRHCRQWIGQPALLAAREPCPIAFSRLTLRAQLEVLVQPPKRSWEVCATLNPFLKVWQHRAAGGRLQVTPWPATAARWLGGEAYAKRFTQLIAARPRTPARPAAGLAALTALLRAKLRPANLYPLLWSAGM
jgi:hypothetical protein